ncbi:SCO family protein [Brevibacillus panacihumi]|uniref:SCO family protein n=1 Tax=Brevibacillus panacihumi TaxID=497735 RepID=A0A3M8DGJ9_9BACL|nr:SCO family protein [Brevibacillus panacihumi]RNB86287.1 SCO family protein [Brevibacillus panacihumi]
MTAASTTALRIRRLLIFLPILVFLILLSSWFFGQPKNVQAALPDISLEALDGSAFPLTNEKKNLRLVELIYTRCPDVCPTTTVRMVQLQKRLMEENLMGNGIEFLTVTIDPVNDTPEVLRKYAQNIGIDPQGWVILRGDEETIKTVTRSLGFFANQTEDGFISHTTSTYLVDENNVVLRKFGMGEDFDPDEIYEELINLKQKG